MDPADDGALDELDRKIKSLSSYRLGLVNEVERLRQKLRDIDLEMHEISTKILVERKTIGEYFEQLGSFKELRQQTLGNIRELRKRASLIEKTLEKIAARAPRETMETAAMKLKAIEWKLETERLSRVEEKKLVGHVKDLEMKLLRWKRAHATKHELVELLLEIKSLKGRLDDFNQQSGALGPELRAHRERLTIMMRTRRQLHGEREGLENDLMELKQGLARTDSQIQSFKESKRRLIEQRRAQEADQRVKKEQELMNEAKRDAMAKLAEGKKLNFDELKLVFGEDATELLK